ncbi:MAG: hypothetical protein IJS05_04400 [Paludibacteraceae bacterium]|nr:hypothetical protein [Paludibacteraceae bacterium]
MREIFDKYWIGILLGILLPAAVGYVYIEQNHLWWLMENFGNREAILTRVCIISVFPNMALLFLFYTTETWKLARGVIIGALPYVLAAIALNF